VTKQNYRFFAKPLTDATNEAIATRLNELGDSAFSCEVQAIEVGGIEIKGVYLVPHDMLTSLQHSEFHRRNVRAYVQEGEGEIRTYVHYQIVSRRLARTKAVSHVKNQLAALKKG
jgi:hypothetical protein